jgi:hypothetical protein
MKTCGFRTYSKLGQLIFRRMGIVSIAKVRKTYADMRKLAKRFVIALEPLIRGPQFRHLAGNPLRGPESMVLKT